MQQLVDYSMVNMALDLMLLFPIKQFQMTSNEKFLFDFIPIEIYQISECVVNIASSKDSGAIHRTGKRASPVFR
jgi:hypothetical protein